MTTEEKVQFIKKYAQENKCYFEPEGTVGFGRECIGIIRNNNYPSYTWYEIDDHRDPRHSDSYIDGGGGPPSDDTKPYPESLFVPNAYHKADVLCVLGRGDAAISQLYAWIKHLSDNGFIIGERKRIGTLDLFDIALHGVTEAIVIKAEVTDGTARNSSL